MVRLVLTAGVYLLANAVGLLIAAALLDDVSVDGAAFVTAVIIFTVVEVVAQPLITQIAVKKVNALVGSSALIATLIGLVVTAWRSDGLTISGTLTSVLATVIVWAAALVAALILPMLLLRQAAGSSTAAER